MPSILIIDDDPDIIQLLEKFFNKKGFETSTASSGSEGIEKLKEVGADVVVCDFKLPDYDGIDMLKKLKIIDPNIEVVIITGYSDVRIAVEALKIGAFEYVTKPLFPDEILHTVQGALEKKDQIRKEKEPQGATRTSTKESVKYIIGESHEAQLIQKHIDLIAPTNMSVVIVGDTGTGKEYVANEIHKQSRRNNDPFVAVDCGALPKEIAGSELFGHVKGSFTGALSDKKGCFEVADMGTLFLDEIGNLSYDNQIKLLRVLQERKVRRIGSNTEIPVDVRIIVATNEDLKELVRKGDFREDIYHRLNEFTIELPPLRERRDDVMIFANSFLENANKDLFKSVKYFSKKAEKAFKLYQWPGNLRELRNVVRRSALLCEGKTIDDKHLPEEIVSPDYFEYFNTGNESDSQDNEPISDLKSVAERAEKRAILQVLRQTGFNKSKTAEILKVDRKTLYNKMRAYDIED